MAAVEQIEQEAIPFIVFAAKRSGARSICSLVFRYAIATGRAERDTAADLRGALKTRSSTPRAAITEPKAIGGLLRAIDDFPGTFIVKSGLQLIALTFLRPSKVRLTSKIIPL